MNIFFNLLYIHYDCTVKSTIWNKKYLPIHYNVAWYIFSIMVALKPRGLTWQNHTPPHTFPVSSEMFFLMAIICLIIDDLSFSKEFRLSSVLMTFVFVWLFHFSLLHISCWASCWQHCWRTRPSPEPWDAHFISRHWMCCFTRRLAAAACSEEVEGCAGSWLRSFSWALVQPAAYQLP